MVWVISAPLGCCDSTKTEVLSLFMGLWESHSMVVRGCLVEGDSTVVISWGLGNNVGSWHFSMFMRSGNCL